MEPIEEEKLEDYPDDSLDKENQRVQTLEMELEKRLGSQITLDQPKTNHGLELKNVHPQ